MKKRETNSGDLPPRHGARRAALTHRPFLLSSPRSLSPRRRGAGIQTYYQSFPISARKGRPPNTAKQDPRSSINGRRRQAGAIWMPVLLGNLHTSMRQAGRPGGRIVRLKSHLPGRMEENFDNVSGSRIESGMAKKDQVTGREGRRAPHRAAGSASCRRSRRPSAYRRLPAPRRPFSAGWRIAH